MMTDDGPVRGIMWGAHVRIDLADSSYLITVDLSSRRTMNLREIGSKPNQSPLDIVLP
jgi:hypothetical protein